MSRAMMLSPDELVAAAGRIAEALAAGGRLVVDGRGRAEHDARHVVVEFKHPVTVGKRALPACRGLERAGTGDVAMSIVYGDDAAGPRADAGPDVGVDVGVDVALSDRPPTGRADGDAVWVRLPSDDPDAAKVDAVLGYHVLWELVHVFLDHRSSDDESPGGASSGDTSTHGLDLYPMIHDGAVRSTPALVAAATASAREKVAESADVRARARADNRATAERARHLVRTANRVFTLGNGGSSTDAADAAMLLGPRALSLTDDVATITALANDVSFDVVFARQLATMGRPGDCAIAYSTSGNSRNVIEAATAARRIGMTTIGFAGYDGGEMVTSHAFDVVLVVRDDSVHRVQEAHAELTARILRS